MMADVQHATSTSRASGAASPVPGRRSRAVAVAFDVAIGVGALIVGQVLAVSWLFFRTGWGRDDVASGDATIAFGLAAAAVPAWLVLLVYDLVTVGATPGQRRAGLVVEGSSMARVGRLAAHPLGLAWWAWLASMLVLAEIPWVSLLPLTALFVCALGGVASFVLAILRPDLPAVHDFLAHTRLAVR
jgi:hypothetical protein